MEVILRPIAAKYLNRMSATDKERFKAALKKLSKEPPEGDIANLSGWPRCFRLRVGGYRALFRIEGGAIFVTNIDTRGQAYNKKNRGKK